MNTIWVRHDGQDAPPWLPPIEQFCAGALAQLGIDGWELSVLFCTDERMRELNFQFRGVDAPTDVLSFSQDGPPGGVAESESAIVGDIVIALGYAEAQALRIGIKAEAEVQRLLVHGILHLHGLTHAPGETLEAHSAGSMLDLQERLLERISASPGAAHDHGPVGGAST